METQIKNYIDICKDEIKLSEEVAEIDFLKLSEFDYKLADLLLEKPNETLKELKKQLDVKEVKILNCLKEIKEEKRKIKKIFSIKGQIEQFYELNPFFYDKAKIFYIWNDERKSYEICDETDLLNKIDVALDLETINSKTKNELIEGLKQVGRSNIPEKPAKHWVQFKEKIFDPKTGQYLFDASPDYHFLNPIEWNVGKSEETPTLDNLFREWVGEEYKQELYELIAYITTRDRFLQRIFALCGGGSNGKGTYVKLINKFIGEKNFVSTELKQLSENYFEPAVLYGKLLAVMGEVSYSDLKNTNMIKKIAGEDKLSFQFKGKTPFTDENTALGICLTNSLPTTPDKSLGFYRKWKIIDFPNQFSGVKVDLIESIPEEEFENLCLKSLNILKNLYETQKLTNEGDFEERVRRYEERSNPVMRFVEEFCEETAGEMVPLREFTNCCNEFLKSKHLRILTAVQVGKILRDEGFSVGQRKINDITTVVIINLSIKNHSNHSNHSKVHSKSHVKSNTNLDGFSGFNGSEQENPSQLLETLKILRDEVGTLIPKDRILNIVGFEDIKELEAQLTKLKQAGEIVEVKEGFFELLN
jgi:P4 family phage/plasmid primase-like protien